MSTFLHMHLDIMNVKYTNDTTNKVIYQTKVINIITALFVTQTNVVVLFC